MFSSIIKKETIILPCIQHFHFVMKVIILAGGKGTRLPNSARDIPKALVPIKGKVMLDHILDGLERHGLKDIRLSLGFRADQIIQHLRDTGREHMEYVVEQEPLGTGGAVRLAAKDIIGDFMVLNGDIMNDIDFSALLKTHKSGTACVVGSWREDARDFGLLDIEDGRVLAFKEKPVTLMSGYINAGCYILKNEHLASAPGLAFMIEQEVFPRLAEEGKLYAFLHKGFWQDAGTEPRLAEVRADKTHL